VSSNCSAFTANFNGGRQPVGALVVSPLALLFNSVLGGVPDADAVLAVVLPLPNVLVSVGQNHSAVAVLLASLEVAFVHAAVLVRQLALTLEQVAHEGSFVGAF